MREIVLDTETTGMDPSTGDRLIEIGCLELLNQIPTGRTYHQYINPERDVPAEAVAVHGLTAEFLADKPVFSEIYTDFLDFIEGATLVIHNAAFDMKFINAELATVGHEKIPMKKVVDTLDIARKKFPGSPASLDALCRRFGIDNAHRELHGALLDSELLAEVYLELMGGRQHGLVLGEDKNDTSGLSEGAISTLQSSQRPVREARSFPLSAEEQEAHTAMLEGLTDSIWKQAG